MRSIVETIGQRAAQDPARAALLCGEQRVTFGELWSRIVAAACHLSDRGVRSGDRVLLNAPSTPAFVYGYFATHLLGAIAVPFDPNAPASRREEFIARTNPAVVLASDDVEALERLPAQQRTFNSLALDPVADLIFTTGTTGRPKGVPLTHRNLATAASHINAVIHAQAGDVDIIPIPLYHAFGLGSLRCFLSAGVSVVLVQGFRLPGEIFSAIERHRASGMIGVPAGFAILLRFGERGLGQFRERLRYIEVGSAPMPLEHKRALIEMLPRTKLFMHYGLTEAARSAFAEFHRDKSCLEAAGLPSPGVKFEVRDESGRACRPGERGALWVSGQHISPGYWDDPALSASVFVDGWMRTSDVGLIDAAGYVHLHSRQDDMINVGGAKVAPDEIERVLAQHPAVSDAACIGVPDPKGISGQALRAFLVAADGQPRVPDVELSRWVARQLEAHKVPTQYEWVASLPRTASGKLLRAALRATLAPQS